MNCLFGALSALALLVGVSPLAAQTNAAAPRRLDAMIGFGSALALAEGEVFVGRPGEFAMFPMPASHTGAVHVFRQGAAGWSEVAAVSADEVNPGDGFGQALSVDRNTLVIAAPKTNASRGAVYVFQRSRPGAEWRNTARLTAGDGAPNDAMGNAVAVEGTTLLVGAPGHAENRGAVYVFQRSGSGSWTQRQKLSAPNAQQFDRFGTSISLDGNGGVIGAPGPFPGQLFASQQPPRPGAAYVYAREGDRWVQQGKLAGEGVLTFGHAVSVSSDRIAVSAPITGGGVGTVLLFQRRPSDEWAEVARLAPGEGAEGSLFGYALAQSRGDVLVGSPSESGGQGVVRVFGVEGGRWVERQRLSARLKGMIVFFGGAVEIDGNRMLVGAPGADFFQGVGVLYERATAAAQWSETTSLVDDTPGLEAVAGGQVDCTAGKAGLFECSEVDLVAFLPVQAMGAERGITVNDLWGWTDPVTGREYAIVGRSDGTTFIDLSDPYTPRYLGELPMTAGATANIWRDIKVYNDHAFIVADGAGAHGVQIFDLTQLRDVRAPPVTFRETAHYDGIFSAHNIVINEETGFAFTVGSNSGGETCGGGLHMIDIRNPKRPQFAGCFSDLATGNARTGYSHDGQCALYRGPDVQYRNREICFGSNETALSIADVTDKESPAVISSASYPNVAYAHQGWLSDDHRYFFMNDEGDEVAGSTPRTRTMVWDIEDLDDPILVKEFLGPTQSSDHNLYVRGRYMYQSNYVSGLRIIDVSDPASPVEVGHFDTVPFGENTPGFAGSWSNYPFFDSGLIIASSMWEGLFVLKKRETRVIP